MPLLPNEQLLEIAVGEAIVLALSGSADIAAPVTADSVYFSPTDDPRAPRPAVRIFEVSQVDLGRETMHKVLQPQAWRLTVTSVAVAPYTVVIKGTGAAETHNYDAQVGDEAADIVAGLAAAIAGDAASHVTDLSEDTLELEALISGAALQVDVSDNLSRAIIRDRAYWQGANGAERTYSFQIGTILSATEPAPGQHALTYAKLLRGRLWHSDVLARLAAAGLVPRRVVSGPTRLDQLVDTITETRASLEVVFSITAGAASPAPVMESASITSTLME